MWIATYAQPCRQVSVVERLVNGRRWPNLAQASERTSSNDKNSRRSCPPRRTRQCPRRYLPRDPHYLLHQETSREPQPRASPANAHPFFKPEFLSLASFMLLVSCFEIGIARVARAAKVAHPPMPIFGLQTRGLSKILALRYSWIFRSRSGCWPPVPGWPSSLFKFPTRQMRRSHSTDGALQSTVGLRHGADTRTYHIALDRSGPVKDCL